MVSRSDKAQCAQVIGSQEPRYILDPGELCVYPPAAGGIGLHLEYFQDDGLRHGWGGKWVRC